MNREMKRMMQRQGQTEADGSPAPRKAAADRSGQRRPPRQRTSPAMYLRQVRDELRQVAWPTRTELRTYVSVVFATLTIMISLIYVLNYGFSKAVVWMFTK